MDNIFQNVSGCLSRTISSKIILANAEIADARATQESELAGSRSASGWRGIAAIIGRLLFAAVFVMALAFKFADMNGTAGYIASAGFPFSLFLAWVAAFFELALALCLLTGAYFAEAALLAGIYVIFLAFAFHGPSHWQAKQEEFGFFIDHFTFFAGLLFAAANGPGPMSIRRSLIR